MSAEPAHPLRERLRQALGERAAPLRIVAEEARREQVGAYLVGGPVRDLMLEVPIGDLDVLLSDRLERVAKRSARRLAGRAILRPRFLTATIEAGDLRIDLSRARGEHYPGPGALPEVQPAALEEDLRRRDFSINAMALPLDARSGGMLLDPFHGQADLERRRMRVLHPGSFHDDPTRLLRGARYCARLGFRFSPETLRLVRLAVSSGGLQTLSRDRIRHEIEKMLDEANVARACEETDKHGLFSAISPGWRLVPEAYRALRGLSRSKRTAPWPEAGSPEVQRACGLRLILLGLPAGVRVRNLAAIGLRGRRAQDIESDLCELLRLRRALLRGLSPGKLDALLSALSEPMLLVLYCATAVPARQDIKHYASVIRHRASPLDGHAARALGLEGPLIGRLMRVARQRSLDGRPVDAAWIRRWLARRR